MGENEEKKASWKHSTRIRILKCSKKNLQKRKKPFKKAVCKYANDTWEKAVLEENCG